MWIIARPEHDSAIIEMCLELNREDPGPEPVPAEHTRNTLDALRADPVRGRALVLEMDGRAEGYAFLISFWSNEMGGEVCNIDELYVKPPVRGRGHGRALVRELAETPMRLWPRKPVAVELEVTPDNQRALRLYEELGFFRAKNAPLRLRPKRSP